MNTLLTRGSRRRWLLATALLLSAAGPAAADCRLGLCDVLSQPKLEITAISPEARIIEHQPIDVSFTLSFPPNKIIKKLPGGKPPKPGQPDGVLNGRVCVRNDTAKTPCVDVKELALGSEKLGILRMKAPAAGATVPIEIAFCSEGGTEEFMCNETAWAGRHLPIAARYEVLLQSYEILHTKAPTTDKVWAVLLGQASDTPPAADSQLCGILGPPTYCVRMTEQGDREDGVHTVVGDVRVGPFDLVPEIDPNLTFWFTIMNAGFSHEEETFLKVMTVFNEMGGGAFGAVLSSQGGNGSSAPALQAATDHLNHLMAANCDAVVVNEIRTALNRTLNGQWPSTLDARTRDAGYWVGGQGDTDVFITPNPAECGDSAKYKVTWRIARTSWEPPLGVTAPLNCFQLPMVSDEGGPSYCPSNSAAAALQCVGRSCDWVSLTCCRYGWDTPRGHRDADDHRWTGWYSEEETGLPPGTTVNSPPAGFVTGVQCRGDFCDDIRLDTDASLTVGEGCTWRPEGACPTSQFITGVKCTSSFCSDLQVQCCPFIP